MSVYWRVWRCGTASATVKNRCGQTTRGMRYRILGDDADDRSDVQFSDDISQRPGESVNLARLIDEKTKKKEYFWSYELFPTNSVSGYQRFINETQECTPAFYALTWHEETTASTSDERFPSLKCIESLPRNTILHCAARGLKYSDLEKILTEALELGIVNIFALQGDGDADHGDFNYASDVVRFIRERFGNSFSICVAGYPDVHPKALSKEIDLLHLKEKVDAGADFIITQFFFESQVFIRFVEDCRKIGISIPIIPGIYPFTNVKLLNRMTNVCHASIPPGIQKQLDQYENNDEAIRTLGINISVDIIKDIRKSGISYGYHLFTLNRSFSAVQIHRQLNSTDEN